MRWGGESGAALHATCLLWAALGRGMDHRPWQQQRKGSSDGGIGGGGTKLVKRTQIVLFHRANRKLSE